METFYFFLAVQLFLLIYQLVVLRNIKASLRKAQDKSLSIFKKMDGRVHANYLLMEKLVSVRILPSALKNVPFADEGGIVLAAKKINVPAFEAAYNGSLIKEENEYLLFFRFDTPRLGSKRIPYTSSIGCIHLAKDFEPSEKTFSQIETKSQYSEDARIFHSKNRSYFLFNDLVSESTERRGLRIGAIDLKTKSLDYITSLEGNFEPVEKNWTPFSYEGEIYFLYSMSPQRIFKLSDPKRNALHTAPFALEKHRGLKWTERWGVLRGGTPAQLVDEEYLTFFHSSFEDEKGIRWYTMGAYLFEARPPFRATRISPHPILFKGVYDTEVLHSVYLGMRSLYPIGFVCEKKEGKDLIHVSCGENDAAIKILTLDKECLFKSLIEC
jgi:predicted GH43/DUF377 family glycosyl hydrolase